MDVYDNLGTKFNKNATPKPSFTQADKHEFDFLTSGKLNFGSFNFDSQSMTQDNRSPSSNIMVSRSIPSS